MTEKPFFIMIYTQKHDKAFPMMDPDNEDMPMFFATEKEAREAGFDHFYASTFGFEVYELGAGL